MYKITIVLIALAITAMSCVTMRQQAKSFVKGLDLEAHRGGRGLMPENTIVAMKDAVDREAVTTLEMDVVVSKDGQVVVSHDPVFNHLITTSPSGKYISADEARALILYQLTYDSIRKYDVGLKPHKDFPRQKKIPAYKPLLTELIDSVENYAALQGREMHYNIETKSKAANDNISNPEPEEFVEKLYKVIDQKNIHQRVVVQSFDERTLQVFHKRHPRVTLSFLVDKDGEKLEEQLQKLGFTPSIYSPAYGIVSKQLVDACHKKNIRIVPWTVNNLADMQKLVAMGVDGIISDYPDLFSQVKRQN